PLLSVIPRQLDVDLQRSGVINTDFRILEALLHKGPLPVNVIGPKLNLTLGAISVAVDRLEVRGLVARAEGKRDRRVHVVALTKEGEKVISPAYQCHAVFLEPCSPVTGAGFRRAAQRYVLAKKKSQQELSDVVLHAQTVYVVILSDASEPITNPAANRAALQ